MRLDIVPKVQHINLKPSHEVDYRRMVLLTQFQTCAVFFIFQVFY